MSRIVQLVRSSPIERHDELSRALYWMWNRCRAEESSVVLWFLDVPELPKCIKLVIPYDAGVTGTHVIRRIMPILQDGEWMIFAETVDSDVFGDPVTLYGITNKSFAKIGGKDLIELIMGPMFDEEDRIEKSLKEEIDSQLRVGRTGTADSVASGSPGDS